MHAFKFDRVLKKRFNLIEANCIKDLAEIAICLNLGTCWLH